MGNRVGRRELKASKSFKVDASGGFRWRECLRLPVVGVLVVGLASFIMSLNTCAGGFLSYRAINTNTLVSWDEVGYMFVLYDDPPFADA
jgi:hypothetical protein